MDKKDSEKVLGAQESFRRRFSRRGQAPVPDRGERSRKINGESFRAGVQAGPGGRECDRLFKSKGGLFGLGREDWKVF